MNRIFKSTTWIFLVCIFSFVLHSCTSEGKYEETLSQTTEEFEKTVIGKWKCIRAGNSFSMDKNEEEHILKIVKFLCCYIPF